MHAAEFVDHAEIDCGAGAYEVHGLGGLGDPQTNVPKVHAGLLLLEKYSHSLHGAAPFISPGAIRQVARGNSIYGTTQKPSRGGEGKSRSRSSVIMR